MGDIEAALNAYVKLCSKQANRPTILKDATFMTTIKTFLADSNSTAIKPITKCLLYLTERKEDALLLSAVSGMEELVGKATEAPFAPNVLHNLLIISSRIATAKRQTSTNGSANGAGDTVAASVNHPSRASDVTPAPHRKFVARKSKQSTYEFESLSDELKANIEEKLLSKKGVISVYFISATKRVVVRTILTIENEVLADIFFDCGCEVVWQVVTIDGEEELFAMYSSERNTKKKVALPDYLDDFTEVVDPKSCLVTEDYAKSGGWFSSITSYVKLW